MAEQQISGVKVTLGSGKVVHLREYKIKHQELATKAVGNRAGDNKWLFSSMLQKELIKLLIFAVNEKEVSAKDVEDLDSLFTPKEYKQLTLVVLKMAGEDEEMGEPQLVFLGGNT